MSQCMICKNFEDECIKLRCGHILCGICLEKYLHEYCNNENNSNPKIKCPSDGCSENIRDAVIRRLLSDEDVNRYEKLCTNIINKIHKCVLEGCPGSICYTDPNVQYECYVCTLFNCVACNDAHMYSTCDSFRVLSTSERIKYCQSEKANAAQILNQRNELKNRQYFIDLETEDLIRNDQLFQCPICNTNILKGEGVVLRNCQHIFCKPCLSNQITSNNQIPITCPSKSCKMRISDGEIESLITPGDFQKYIIRYNNIVPRKAVKCLQCRGVDCNSFYSYSEKPKSFTCLTCKSKNCIKCDTVHKNNENCDEYKQKMSADPQMIDIKKKIHAGILLSCPDCSTLLNKISGCNWVQCPKCLLEICWLLKMRRWGPKGHGDTSDGCKCRADNVTYCHELCEGTTCLPHKETLITIKFDDDGQLIGQ